MKSLQCIGFAALLLCCCVSPTVANNFRIHLPAKHEADQVTPPPLIQPRDKWAVLIGVSSYIDASIPPLHYAAQNVSDLANVLLDPAAGRFAPDHVIRLTSTHAKLSSLNSALLNDWLPKHALPSDLVFVYLCGRTKFSQLNSDPLLLPFDASDDESSALSLKEALAELHRRIQSENIVCVFDLSCVDAAPPNVNLKLREIAETCHITVLSANDLAHPSYENPVTQRSMLCQSLTAALQANLGIMPIGTLSDYVCKNVQAEALKILGKQQLPQLAINISNPMITNTAIGCPPKAGVHKVSFGHTMDDLVLNRPDLLTVKVRTNTPAPQLGEEAPPDEPDDAGAESNQVDFGSYMDRMKKAIQSKWQPPGDCEQHKLVAIFSILRDGSIVDPIVDSAGGSNLQNAALDALRQASPLDPLPPGSPDFVQVRYQFEWPPPVRKARSQSADL